MPSPAYAHHNVLTTSITLYMQTTGILYKARVLSGLFFMVHKCIGHTAFHPETLAILQPKFLDIIK